MNFLFISVFTKVFFKVEVANNVEYGLDGVGATSIDFKILAEQSLD